MWLLFFITSTCVGVHLLTSSVLDYLSRPVISHMDIIYEKPSFFPTVSFQISKNDDLKQNFLLKYSWNDENCDFSDFEQLSGETYCKLNSGNNKTGDPIPLKKQTRMKTGLYLRSFTGFLKIFLKK